MAEVAAQGHALQTQDAGAAAAVGGGGGGTGQAGVSGQQQHDGVAEAEAKLKKLVLTKDRCLTSRHARAKAGLTNNDLRAVLTKHTTRKVKSGMVKEDLLKLLLELLEQKQELS